MLCWWLRNPCLPNTCCLLPREAGAGSTGWNQQQRFHKPALLLSLYHARGLLGADLDTIVHCKTGRRMSFLLCKLQFENLHTCCFFVGGKKRLELDECANQIAILSQRGCRWMYFLARYNFTCTTCARNR